MLPRRQPPPTRKIPIHKHRRLLPVKNYIGSARLIADMLLKFKPQSFLISLNQPPCFNFTRFIARVR